jgi:hypothetical protein
VYTGPVLRARRGSDNVQQDFYSDSYGRLFLASNLTGTQIVPWSSNSTIFCATLYDQSTAGNHASQTTATLQPIIANYTMSNNPVATFYLDTRTGRYFNLSNGTIPASAQTVIARHGTIDNTIGAIISGGATTTNNFYSLRRDTTQYKSVFFNNDVSYSRYSAGNVVAETVDASGNNKLYVNGDVDLTTVRTSKNTNTANQRLCSSSLNEHLNGDFLFAFVFAGVITDTEIDTLSFRFQRGNVVRLPSLEKYIGSASNLGNRELLLCSTSNSSGKYIYQSDIAPNFSVYFDAKVPTWSNNSFRFGLHSTLQSFYYSAPNSNQLRMLDMNGATLQSWTLNSSNLLSNNVYNSFKIVNSESNMIVTVNNRAYAGLLPNHPLALKNWRNGCFSFEASNVSSQTGSNAVRRFYSQSITRISDPVVVKDSLTSTVVNTAKLGATRVSTRTLDTNVIFSDWIFGSNIYSTSNCRLSNLAASNVRSVNMYTSNIFASNLGNAAFCNLIPFSMVTGAAACNGSNFSSVTATNIFNNTIFTSNIRTKSTLNINDSTVSSLEVAVSAMNNAMTNADNVFFQQGKDTGLYNSAIFGYTHVADNSDTNFWNLGINGQSRILNVTGKARVGINVTNPTRELDVSGDSRTRGNKLVDGSVTTASLTTSNVFTSNLSSGAATVTGALSSATIAASGNVTVAGTLTVNNRNMSLLGGTGTTPTTFALNSTGSGTTTSIIQFVNSGHRIVCTDSNPWDGVTAAGSGHNIFYRSGGHNFSGATTMNTSLRVGDSGATTVKDFRISSATIPANASSIAAMTVAHNYNWTSYACHFLAEDTVLPTVFDAFTFKLIAKNSNDVKFDVTRVDGTSWTRPFNVIIFYYRL